MYFMHRALAHCCRSVRASHQQQYLGGRLGFFFFTEARLSQAPTALSSQSSKPWRDGAGIEQCLAGRADFLFFFSPEVRSSRAHIEPWAQSFRSGRGGADIDKRGEAERTTCRRGEQKAAPLRINGWRRGKRGAEKRGGERKRKQNKRQKEKRRGERRE